MSTEPNTYAIYTPTEIPAKKTASRQSKFPVDQLLVGQAFNVSAEDVQSARSVIRSRKAKNPLLNIISRANADGSFMIVRKEDLAPTAPATPVAETPAS